MATFLVVMGEHLGLRARCLRQSLFEGAGDHSVTHDSLTLEHALIGSVSDQCMAKRVDSLDPRSPPREDFRPHEYLQRLVQTRHRQRQGSEQSIGKLASDRRAPLGHFLRGLQLVKTGPERVL